MSGNIELISDGNGMAVLGSPTDVEQFLASSALEQSTSRSLDLHKLWAATGALAAVAQVGSHLAANSGRWVKLTAESAEAVRKYGLMDTKTPGIKHAMIGKPGDVAKWLQIDQTASMLLSGPFLLTTLSTMMQQQAMQHQMDEIVEYLQEMSEKVDDILRGQKDSVLADMIGVDLIVQEALTIRDEVGRVSEVTWSKVQMTSQTLARTQAYALRELDAIAEKLRKKADLGEIAKATREAEPQVREWLAVLASTFQLQEGVSILELDRILDISPDELERHRLGLAKARQNRLAQITRSTDALLAQMDDTVRKANTKVLLNPFDAPAAVKSSNQVAKETHTFRGRLGIESDRETVAARRWSHAAGDALEKVRVGASEGASATKRFSDQTFERATNVFRAVDLDGDGIPDQPRAVTATEQAGAAIKGAAQDVSGAVAALFHKKKSTQRLSGTPDTDSPETEGVQP